MPTPIAPMGWASSRPKADRRLGSASEGMADAGVEPSVEHEHARELHEIRRLVGEQPKIAGLVHADLIRQLDVLAREENCKRGVYIVTGQFTEEARNISLKMAVDLVDIKKLFSLLEAPPYDGRWTFRVVDEKGVLNDLNRMPLLSFEKEVDLFLKSTGFKVTKIRRVPASSVGS
jgi:hypothetical protein